MIRVLIVDDEPIAIDSMEYMIRKNMEDVEVVGKSRSGRDAIEKAYNTRPDVVLMDINMPGINGLEAMRQIKEANPVIRFIIVTAFDYFDYAVEAVALDAEEYLLKPVREAKLVETLRKVTGQVEQQREKLRKELEIKEKFEMIVPIMETGFINALCMFEDNAEELKNFSRLLGNESTGGYVMIIAFEDKDSGGGNNRIGAGVKGQALYNRYREALKSMSRCMVGPIMLNRLVVYVCSDFPESSFEQRLSALKLAENLYDRVGSLHPEISIGIGRNYGRLDEAKKSYREALQALSMSDSRPESTNILHFDDAVAGMEDNDALYEDQMFRLVFAKAAAGDSTGAVLAFERMFSGLCKNEPLDFDRMKNKTIALVVEFGKRWGNVIGNSCNALSALLQAEHMDVLHELCRRFIRDAVERIDSGKQRKISAIIEQADRYMEEHFDQDIALESVARAVNLSPYYFSRFYKDETGTNFIDRLTAIRMEKAKQYLARAEYTVKDVARMVGYADPNYFSKLFKKITNMTATEYKESCGR